jgi:hypothetical protein
LKQFELGEIFNTQHELTSFGLVLQIFQHKEIDRTSLLNPSAASLEQWDQTQDQIGFSRQSTPP